MNLNELTFYDDPTDQWAAAAEFELRALSYRAWVIGESLRIGIEGVNGMAEAFRRLAPHVKRLTEASLELGGVPLEMQREVLAITQPGLPLPVIEHIRQVEDELTADLKALGSDQLVARFETRCIL